jgi:hypothetical protein
MSLDRSLSPVIWSKTAAQWSAQNPYLARGDLGVETDTGKEKLGTGSRWADIPYNPAVDNAVAVNTLTYAATVTTNAASGDIFDLTLTGNVTLGNPTNGVNGQTIRWRIRQDATGSRTITLGNKFVIPSSATSPLPFSTAANAMDILAATYHAGRDRWDVVAMVPGY